MYSLLSHVCFILLCTGMLFQSELSLLSTWAFLSIVSISALSLYHEKSGFLLIVKEAFLLLCCFFTPFCFFLPVMAYEAPSLRSYWKKENWFWKGFCILYPILFVIALWNYQTAYGMYETFFMVIFSCIAVLLRLLNLRSESLLSTLHDMRDRSVAQADELKRKNHDLMDKQDYEIYLATLQERNRIAREIHDNVGHLLTRSILQVGALRVISKEPQVQEGLNETKETLDTAMNSIRQSVHDLHDESVNLQTSFEELIRSTPSLKVSLDFDMNDALPKNLKYSFIAVFKEALTNTVKHSNATQMTVIVREHPAFYQLLIEDNGTNASSVFTNGIGLLNMKERIESLNGSIQFSCEHGFRIFISVIK